MAKFEKGNKSGKGRVKGIPNKNTMAIKDMIREALDNAGGSEYLLAQAHENPSAFLALVGKILPKELEVSGPGGGAIPSEFTIKFVTPK